MGAISPHRTAVHYDAPVCGWARAMRRPRLGLLIVFALCAMAIAASAPAAPAAVQVAYRCDVDICLLDPDAPSAVTNLTDNGATSLDETPSGRPMASASPSSAPSAAGLATSSS
jgi:hypothetical protein